MLASGVSQSQMGNLRLSAVHTRLWNALTVTGLPAVNVHTIDCPEGRQTLELCDTGSFLLLGIMARDAEIRPRDAARPEATCGISDETARLPMPRGRMS